MSIDGSSDAQRPDLARYFEPVLSAFKDPAAALKLDKHRAAPLPLRSKTLLQLRHAEHAASNLVSNFDEMEIGSTGHTHIDPAIIQPLLREVCSMLANTKDVKHFRLASKLCAAIGAEYLIPNLTVMLCDRHYDRFKRIADHPLISKSVKHISFFIDCVPAYHDRHEWEEFGKLVYLVDDGPHVRFVEYSGNPAMIYVPTSGGSFRWESRKIPWEYHVHGWKRYLYLVREQQDMVRSEWFWDSIVAPRIAELKKLQSVAIDRLPSEPDARAYWLFAHRYPKDSWYVRIPLDPKRSYMECGPRIFQTILWGLVYGRIALRSLYLPAFDWRMLAPRATWNMTPIDESRHVSNFSPLDLIERLDCSRVHAILNYCPRSSDSAWNSDLLYDHGTRGPGVLLFMNGLRTLMAQSWFLTTLELSFLPIFYPSDLAFQALTTKMSPFGGAARDTWRQLEAVSLAGLRVDYGPFSLLRGVIARFSKHLD